MTTTRYQSFSFGLKPDGGSCDGGWLDLVDRLRLFKVAWFGPMLPTEWKIERKRSGTQIESTWTHTHKSDPFQNHLFFSRTFRKPNGKWMFLLFVCRKQFINNLFGWKAAHTCSRLLFLFLCVGSCKWVRT